MSLVSYYKNFIGSVFFSSKLVYATQKQIKNFTSVLTIIVVYRRIILYSLGIYVYKLDNIHKVIKILGISFTLEE
jgi:hypothetical protein